MIPAGFDRDTLHPDRLHEYGASLDRLFVRLVFDLLHEEYPALSYHDSGGKDGAIDLWSDSGNERCVFECKHIGPRKNQQPWEAARNSWKEVHRHLENNLSRGLNGCQPQYRPWFSDHPRAVRYTYLVSCVVTPAPDRLDELRNDIKSAFEQLSTSASDLDHLKNVVVDVLDWNGLRLKLEARPQVVFKWFRDQLPIGLRQFTQDRQLLGFRRYQQEDILPYYCLRKHLEIQPQNSIQDEVSLWKSLAEGTPGIVISGISGVGKSRLMIELGKLAANDGWQVFETLPSISADTIDRVARSYSSQGVLFLFDYLENLPAFRDISLHIAQLAGSGIRVRLIASARESFARSDQIIDDSIFVLQHSPEQGTQSGWWNSYRLAAFAHIVGHLGVVMPDDLRSDIPAIAVLESELKSAKDSPTEAMHWASRRLAILQREKDIPKKCLALVAAQCPFDDNAYARLSDEHRAAFIALLNSGWIETRESEEGVRSYWVVHHYLADQIVLLWLEEDGPRGLAKTTEVRELLAHAYTLGTVSSVIATLQRVIGKVSGFGLADFSDLLQSEIAANSVVWRMHRQDVLYTRLLSPTAKVLLLYRLGDYWQGAEREDWFQLEIAALAKALALSGSADGLPDPIWMNFESLVLSLASVADERNMVVTYGLRLLPSNQSLQQIALDWLGRFADRFGATYVIRAWLDMRLPWRLVQPAVRIWLSRFGKSVDAQFVLAAWLRTAGAEGINQFRPEILAWCEKHECEVVAQHVYSAWLKAGGACQAISGSLQDWLTKNRTLEEEPSYLFRRWLRAGGIISVILPHLKEWLDHHAGADCASYVYSAAADVDGLKELVREPMLAWISARSTSPEARACIVAWLRGGHERGLVAKHVRDWLSANGNSLEAGEVIGKWLEAKGKLEMVLPYAKAWVALHGNSPYCSILLQTLLERELIPDEVRDLALQWLETRSGKHDTERVLSAWLRGHLGVEAIHRFVMEWCRSFPADPNARYIYEQWLLADAGYQPLFENILAWLSAHDRELDAGRVLAALLRAGAPWTLYKDHLIQWTRHNSQDRDATFFYHAWLADVGRKPSLIQKSITAWLEKHAEWKDADFVLNAWLKHTDAPTETVRVGYERWMAIYGKSSQARTVRENWEASIERERRARIDNIRRAT